jgi:hypothetical protein
MVVAVLMEDYKKVAEDVVFEDYCAKEFEDYCAKEFEDYCAKEFEDYCAKEFVGASASRGLTDSVVGDAW